MPSHTAARHASSVALVLASASSHWSSRSSASVSQLKVDMVVNPPQKPVVSRMRVSSFTQASLEGQGHDEPDEETAEDVDRQGARGKDVSAEALHGSPQPVAGDGANQAAEGDQERALDAGAHVGPISHAGCRAERRIAGMASRSLSRRATPTAG